MAKEKKNFGEELIAAAEDALAFAKGEPSGVRIVNVPDDIDVRGVREKLGLSQQAFADRYGFPVGTVREWEQHRRKPKQAARVLLKVIEREPQAVERALAYP